MRLFHAEAERVYSCKDSGRSFVTPRLCDSCLCVAVGDISAPGWMVVVVVLVMGRGEEGRLLHCSRQAEQRRLTRKSGQCEVLRQTSAE